jgi:hypothetical protein
MPRVISVIKPQNTAPESYQYDQDAASVSTKNGKYFNLIFYLTDYQIFDSFFFRKFIFNIKSWLFLRLIEIFQDFAFTKKNSPQPQNIDLIGNN